MERIDQKEPEIEEPALNDEVDEVAEFGYEPHLVDAAENDGEFSDREVKTNFETDVPFTHELSETKHQKKSMVGLIAFTLCGVFVVGAVALVFLLKGKSRTDTAVVKDNSPKSGVNANTSDTSIPNFQDDYRSRYGNSSIAGQTVGANPIGSAGGISPVLSPLSTVGNITAPPPPAPAADYAPESSRPAPAPAFGDAGKVDPEPKTDPARETAIVTGVQGQNASYPGIGRNEQASLYFYDRDNSGNNDYTSIKIENSPTVKPDFGTVLPVKLLGRIHTLGANGFARLELTRTVEGRWGIIPRGTLFVGRISGGEGNRVFVSLIGYIEQRSNRLVTIGGDLQDKDGALGMQGDIKRLDSRWKRVFGELLSSAKAIGSAYLLGRNGGSGAIINNGQFERVPDAVSGSDATRYTVVAAGSLGYLIINDLPPAVESDDRLAAAKKSLSDDEILQMIQTSVDGAAENRERKLSSEAKLALGKNVK